MINQTAKLLRAYELTEKELRSQKEALQDQIDSHNHAIDALFARQEHIQMALNLLESNFRGCITPIEELMEAEEGEAE